MVILESSNRPNSSRWFQTFFILTIDLHCLISPKLSNLMIPAILSTIMRSTIPVGFPGESTWGCGWNHEVLVGRPSQTTGGNGNKLSAGGREIPGIGTGNRQNCFFSCDWAPKRWYPPNWIRCMHMVYYCCAVWCSNEKTEGSFWRSVLIAQHFRRYLALSIYKKVWLPL